VHRDRKHGERSQCAEKRNSTFDTHHPVGLHSNILAVKRAFNKVLKILKTLKDFRLMEKQINPSEFAEISIKLT
jgi:hypothetical protein